MKNRIPILCLTLLAVCIALIYAPTACLAGATVKYETTVTYDHSPLFATHVFTPHRVYTEHLYVAASKQTPADAIYVKRETHQYRHKANRRHHRQTTTVTRTAVLKENQGGPQRPTPLPENQT